MMMTLMPRRYDDARTRNISISFSQFPMMVMTARFLFDAYISFIYCLLADFYHMPPERPRASRHIA